MNIYDETPDDKSGTTEITFDQYEEYKKACQYVISKAEAAAKLAESPEFIDIVIGEYFEKEPQRLAGIMTSGRLNDKQFTECTADLRAIGSLRVFLQEFIAKGNIAREELADIEEAYNESIEADSQ